MEEVFSVTCANAYTTIAGVVPIVVLVAAALGHPTFLILQPFSLVLDAMMLAYFWYICVTGELSTFAAFSLCLI